MFKKIGGLFCALALITFIAETIVEATDNSNNASNNSGGAVKAVPKAKLKQFKEKK